MINNNQIVDLKIMVFLAKGGKMRDKKKSMILSEFTKLVHDYRGAIAKDYCSAFDDDEDLGTPRQKIIKAFRAVKIGLKKEMLKLVYSEFAAHARKGDIRLENLLLNSKVELLSTLIFSM